MQIHEIKKLFYKYRNGIIADTLRKAGMPYDVIFGLQLPQLTEISKLVDASAMTAEMLWADREVRESRLLACRVYPKKDLSMERALEMASELRTREEADILSFSLLRHTDFAQELINLLLNSEDTLTHYCGEALRRNLQS